jgi:hypothetical protein
MPDIVALVLCPATTFVNGDQVHISGLYDVEEFQPCEPTNYVLSPCWLVASRDNGIYYYIDASDFGQQVWPESYGRSLVQEREMAFAEEEPWRF